MQRRLLIYGFILVGALYALRTLFVWGDAAANPPIPTSAAPSCLPGPTPGDVYYTPPGLTLSPSADDTRTLAWGDVDNDNDPDLIVGNYAQSNVLYFNDGTGQFPISQTIGPGNDNTTSVAFGFINNDSYLDLIVGNNAQANVIYFNDGSGGFTTNATFGTGTDATYALAIGDANGDAFPDIAVGNYNQQNRLYLNNGTGQFPTTINFGTGTDATRALAWGNVDGDNDLDLIVGNLAQQNRVYLNSGAGSFPTSVNFGSGSDDTVSLDVGDITGDGFIDIVTANLNYAESATLSINNGSGQFTTSISAGSRQNSAVRLADVDRDNDLDIILTTTVKQSPNVILLNDGDLTFYQTRYFAVSTVGEHYALAVTDVNGDDDLDIAVGTRNAPNTIVFNQQRTNPYLYITSTLLLEDTGGTPTVLRPSYTTQGQFLYFSILQENNTFYLWASNWGGGATSAVSREERLESQDGLIWSNRATTNLVDTVPNYNYLYGFSAMQKNGAIYEAWEEYYYVTVNGMWVQTVRYLTSNDGLNWIINNQPILSSARDVAVLRSNGLYHMWASADYDFATTGSSAGRYRTSSTGGTGWGHWQTGGTPIQVNGDEIFHRRVMRVLPDDSYEMFYLNGSVINRAISVNGSQFTIENVALMDLAEILPNYYYLVDFEVIRVDEEYWFYFSYMDVNSVSHLTMARPEPQFPVSGLMASNDSPTVIGNSTQLTSTITGGNDVTYSWAFGDGSYGCGPNHAHTYLATGTYTAVVTATNPLSVVTTTTTVEVVDIAITDLAAANDSPTLVGTNTHLTATVSGGTNIQYTWAFGDGSYGNGANPTHMYPAVGNYTAVVTATNGNNTLSTTTSVSVIDVAISGLAAANDSPTIVSNPTHLSATVSGGTNIQYTWAFGDGSYGNGANPTHTYPAVGNYTAIVTATNTNNTLTASTQVQVIDVAVSGLAAANDSPTIISNPTHLSATVSGGTNIQYTWAFGDGSYGSGANPTHTYPAVGNYTAIVTATNTNNTLSASTLVQVIDMAISGLAAANDSPTILGNNTHLFATVSGGTNIQYTWAFGDGTYGSGASSSHVYPAVGNYTAIVTATNSNNSQWASTFVTIESGIRHTYLPIISYCEANPIWADIVLVIDTSGSMADPTEPGGVSKLVAAQTAAATFLSFLDLTIPGDQAALVTFDHIATLKHPLSRNEATLLTAINNLQLGSLTRMDLGLQVARLELTGVRHDPDNQTAIIFLTDGQPNGTTEAEVLAQALLAKNAGIAIYTIGLGVDVNSTLLQAVASTPAHYYPSPSTDDLSIIYQQIAGSLACR